MGGLAVHDNVAVVSLTQLNKLLFANATTGETLAQVPVDSPRGLAFDLEGKLLVLSGKRLLKYSLPSGLSPWSPSQLATPRMVS